MSTITEEQKKRMEENRQKALQLRAAKQLEKQQNEASTSVEIKSYRPGFGRQMKQFPVAPSVVKVINGMCRLISRSRFTVDVEYHQGLIEVFKTIPHRQYEPGERTWNFPIQEHNTLINATKTLQSAIRLTPLPSTIVNVFTNATPQREITTVDLSTIDQRLTEDLYLFQREGVFFGIGKQGRLLLADDMGLGKTIQAMAICAYYRNEWPLLVIAPSSVRYAWQQSFLKWMPSIDPQKIVVINSGKDELIAKSVLIISYELVSKNRTLLLEMDFQVVIVDESHFLKTHTAARTQAIVPILKNARRVCLLSGTPALSRPMELFTQLNTICPKIFSSFKQFGERYCDARITPFCVDYSGSSNMSELQLLMEETLMIRRLKSDVLAQLPAKRREMIILDPTLINTESREMKSFVKRIDNETLKGLEKRGALLEYYAHTGKFKIKAIKDYLANLLTMDRKFLCFAHHRIVLDKICDMLTEKNCNHIRIDGSTTSKEKNRLCEVFQFNDSYRVAVLSITAASMGITLTAAHLVVFAELFWNPGILTQAEDRAHRIGQADSVLVQYLVATQTADDYLWPLVSKKLDVLNKAGLSKDNFRNADTTSLKSVKETDKYDCKEFDLDEEDLQFLESARWDDNGVEVTDTDQIPSKKKDYRPEFLAK